MAGKQFATKSDDKVVAMVVQVAKEYGAKTPTQLAKELGVSTARVAQWATNMRALGVNIPRFHRAGVYTRAIVELNQKAPHLLTKKAKELLRPIK